MALTKKEKKRRNLECSKKIWKNNPKKYNIKYWAINSKKVRQNNPKKYNKNYFSNINKRFKNKILKKDKFYFKKAQKLTYKKYQNKYNYDYFTSKTLKSLYNIIIKPNDIKNIRSKYKNKCAICQQKFLKLCLDHCHKTNKIRGMLCPKCNTMLGFAKDDIKILQNAIKYLKKQEVNFK